MKLDSRILMSPNKLVHHLDKAPEDFTKEDIIKFILDNNIEMINFRYVGGDGRLKVLNFIISSKAQLDRILSVGERVDGSSLFSFIDAASSDLYVIPRYKTAFVNPFSEIPTLEILCAYYTKDGERLGSDPGNILEKACAAIEEKTGLEFHAMAELEYYVFYDRPDLYPAIPQRGYHDTSPFCKWEHLRVEAMQAIAQAGGQIKYGHAEVGHICEGGRSMEQHEIEFMPVRARDAADQVIVAKWLLRMIGHKYGVNISFAPKIMVGHAGSGLHIHTMLMKNGRNMMADENGLTDEAKKAIAGYLKLSPSLTAFGNTVPTSYLRLVPHQEAPTNICWGDRNRSVLVRVPLGWINVKDMVNDANPGVNIPLPKGDGSKQTVEFRCPDGSASIYFLMAGLAVAARHGLESKDALQYAKDHYVDVNIFDDEHKHVQAKLEQLPISCFESAEQLIRQRDAYEELGVFPDGVIDGLAKKLKAYDDKDLSERLYGKNDEIAALVEQYIHCA